MLVVLLLLQLSAPALLQCGTALWAFCGMEADAAGMDMPMAHDCCPDSKSSEALPLIAPELDDANPVAHCGMSECHCFHATTTAADAQLPEGLPASKFSTEQLQPELKLLSGFSLNSLSPAALLKQYQPKTSPAGHQLSSDERHLQKYGSAPGPLRIIYCSYLI